VGSVECVFVQQNSSPGLSGSVIPNFGSVSQTQTIADNGCLWKNMGAALYTAGSGLTGLNNPLSNKLGGPGGAMLIADVWQGTSGYATGQVIEAPIGWLQMASTGGQSGQTRPQNFGNIVGEFTGDGTVLWVCLGRSKYATCLPDADGTQNTGGMSNPALCIADYLQTPKNQFGLGATLTLDSIDSVIAAANIADEAVVIEVLS
jgi:hypothetical protein